MDRGAWWDVVHGVTESGMTEWLTLTLEVKSLKLTFKSKDAFKIFLTKLKICY